MKFGTAQNGQQKLSKLHLGKLAPLEQLSLSFYSVLSKIRTHESIL